MRSPLNFLIKDAMLLCLAEADGFGKQQELGSPLIRLVRRKFPEARGAGQGHGLSRREYVAMRPRSLDCPHMARDPSSSRPPPRVSFSRRVVESVSRPLSDSELYLIRRYLDHAQWCHHCREGSRLTCSRTISFLGHLDRHLYAGRDGVVYSRRQSDFRNTRVEIPPIFHAVRDLLLDGMRLEENVARYVERESVGSSRRHLHTRKTNQQKVAYAHGRPVSRIDAPRFSSDFHYPQVVEIRTIWELSEDSRVYCNTSTRIRYK